MSCLGVGAFGCGSGLTFSPQDHHILPAPQAAGNIFQLLEHLPPFLPDVIRMCECLSVVAAGAGILQDAVRIFQVDETVAGEVCANLIRLGLGDHEHFLVHFGVTDDFEGDVAVGGEDHHPAGSESGVDFFHPCAGGGSGKVGENGEAVNQVEAADRLVAGFFRERGQRAIGEAGDAFEVFAAPGHVGAVDITCEGFVLVGEVVEEADHAAATGSEIEDFGAARVAIVMVVNREKGGDVDEAGPEEYFRLDGGGDGAQFLGRDWGDEFAQPVVIAYADGMNPLVGVVVENDADGFNIGTFAAHLGEAFEYDGPGELRDVMCPHAR